MFHNNYKSPPASAKPAYGYAYPDRSREPTRGADMPASLPQTVRQYVSIFKDREATNLLTAYENYVDTKSKNTAWLHRDTKALDYVKYDLKKNIHASDRLDAKQSALLTNRENVVQQVDAIRQNITMHQQWGRTVADELRGIQDTDAQFKRQQAKYIAAAHSNDAESDRLTPIVRQLGDAIKKNSSQLTPYNKKIESLKDDLNRASRDRSSPSDILSSLKEARQIVDYLDHKYSRLRSEYTEAEQARSSAADMANRMRGGIGRVLARRSEVAITIAHLSHKANALSKKEAHLQGVLKDKLKTLKGIDEKLSDIYGEKGNLEDSTACLRRLEADKSKEVNGLSEMVSETQHKLDTLVWKMRDQLKDHFAREYESKQKKSGARSNSYAGGSHRKERPKHGESPRSDHYSAKQGGTRCDDAQDGYQSNANDNQMPDQVPASFPQAAEPEPTTPAIPFPEKIIMGPDERMNGEAINGVIGKLRAAGLNDQALLDMRAAMQNYLENGHGLQFFDEKYKKVFSSSLSDIDNTRVNFGKLYLKLPSAKGTK